MLVVWFQRDTVGDRAVAPDNVLLVQSAVCPGVDVFSVCGGIVGGVRDHNGGIVSPGFAIEMIEHRTTPIQLRGPWQWRVELYPERHGVIIA